MVFSNKELKYSRRGNEQKTINQQRIIHVTGEMLRILFEKKKKNTI